MSQAQSQATDHCGILSTLSYGTKMAHRERLLRFLREKSLFRGEFVLSSGQKSKYYLDCKLTTLNPEGSYLTGLAVLEHLDDMGVHPDAIGGPTMGADPIVSATVLVSHLEKRPLPGFLIRKEKKQHGRERQIEGIEGRMKIKRVAIIDEVCTEGCSTQEAIDIAKKEGYEIVAVISLVDREQGGSDRIKKNYNYRAIFTASEIMESHGESNEPARSTAQPTHSRA